MFVESGFEVHHHRFSADRDGMSTRDCGIPLRPQLLVVIANEVKQSPHFEEIAALAMTDVHRKLRHPVVCPLTFQKELFKFCHTLILHI